MNNGDNLFDLFGGIRPTARAVGESPGTVHGWKRAGRIPAEKQPHVLEVGLALGLPITAENVVFPLGRSALTDPDGLAATPAPVACDRQPTLQQKDVA